MGSKRRNDNNQMSKEDYEAQQLRDEIDGEGSNDQVKNGFSRASEEVMRSRRIARVSNRSRVSGRKVAAASAGIVGRPTTFSSSSSSSSSSNPFAKTVLNASKATSQHSSTTNKDAAPRPNPFAKISFANANNNNNNNNENNENAKKRTKVSTSPMPLSTTKPSFSFGNSITQSDSNANAMVNAKAAPSFSFGNKGPTTVTAKPFTTQSTLKPSFTSTSTTTTTATTKTNKQNDGISLSEGTLLNLTMLRMAQLEHKANPFADWSEWAKTYVEKATDLRKKEEEEQQQQQQQQQQHEKENKENGVTLSTSSGSSNSNNNGAAATAMPSSSSFSFGSSSSSTPPTTNTTTTTTTTTSTSPKTRVVTNAEDPEKIAKIVNEDDIELYECKAKHHKFIEKESTWKSFSAGTLRLTQSKTTKKAQLVIRNDSGKVQFNIRVSEQIKIHTAKNKVKGDILFGAVQDANVGPEKFRITVKIGDLDGLVEQLKAITG